jgi:hypothetical protein
MAADRAGGPPPLICAPGSRRRMWREVTLGNCVCALYGDPDEILRLIQGSVIDLAKHLLSCNDQSSIKIV